MIIKIDILFVFMIVFNYFGGKLELYICFYLFILMHELAHIITSLILKVDVEIIELAPFGVHATYLQKISNLKEFVISLAGPIMSMLLAILYGNRLYMMINMIIVILNLLPIYPLDGGKILRCILKVFLKENQAINLSKYITNILLIILAFASVFLCLKFKNFSLLFTTLCIFKIASNEMKKDKIIKRINYLQNTQKCIN